MSVSTTLLKPIKRYLIIFYVGLLSLVPVFWVKADEIIAGGDDNIFLNPACFVRFTAWNNSGFAANLNTDFPRAFPFGYFWILFQSLGLDNALIEKLWLFSMWFIAGLSIAYLLKVFFPKHYKTLSFFSIPIYLLNPFNIFIPLSVAIRYVHSFMPLVLGLFAKGLHEESLRKKHIYAIFFGFATVLAASAFSNAANGFVIVLVPFLYLLYYLLCHGKKNLKANLLHGLKSLAVFVLFNVYWIWGFFYLGPVLSFVSGHNWGYFGTTSIFDIFRTLGGWAFGSGPMMVFEHAYYKSLGIVFASYVIVLIAFSSVSHLKKSKSLLFFSLLAIISIFLVKGILYPWEEVYKYFFENIGALKVFREPWTKFMPIYILSLSVLFGYGCFEVLKHLSKVSFRLFRYAFILFVVFVVLVQGFPALVGVNFWRLNFPGQRSYVIKVPDYWYEMVDFFNENDKDSVVYITPRNFSARDYMWESGLSGLTPIEYIFIKNPIRYSSFTLVTGDPIYNFFFVYGGNYHALKSETFINFLNMLGIRYIIQENDISWGEVSPQNYSPQIMDYVFSNKDYLEKYKQFGKIDIYKVRDEYYKPIIYLSNKVIWVDGPVFGFSFWDNVERDNFSVISSIRGLKDIKDDDFVFSYQEFLDPLEAKEVSEISVKFDFDIKREGKYTLYMVVLDNGKVKKIPVAYSMDDGGLSERTLTLDKDSKVEKYLDMLVTNDMFRPLFLSEFTLTEGSHSLTLGSSVFENKNFGGISFLVLNEKLSQGPKNPLPELFISKVNDSEFMLDVKGGSGSYILNFAQDYDDSWEVFLKTDNGFKTLKAPHFVVNGVNNGWYVNPESLGLASDYRLMIRFSQQNVLNLAVTVSVISLVLGGIYLVYLKFSYKKRDEK